MGVHTAAGAWGSFAQTRAGGARRAVVEVKWGRLRLRTLALSAPAAPATVRATAAGRGVAATSEWKGGRLLLTFAPEVRLGAGEALAVDLPS